MSLPAERYRPYDTNLFLLGFFGLEKDIFDN